MPADTLKAFSAFAGDDVQIDRHSGQQSNKYGCKYICEHCQQRGGNHRKADTECTMYQTGKQDRRQGHPDQFR